MLLFTIHRPTGMSEMYYVTVNAKPTFPTSATERFKFFIVKQAQETQYNTFVTFQNVQKQHIFLWIRCKQF